MKEHWSVCTIDELGVIDRGRSKHRPPNDLSLFNGEYPFIQTADVKRANLYITEYSDTYNEIGLAQSKLWPKGTLCMTIAANIAETAILGIDACFPDSVVGFTPHTGTSDTKFVKYMLDMFKVYMQQISRGTTQDNLSLEKIRKVKFEIPKYSEQVKLSAILSAYDELIEKNNRKIAILQGQAQELYKEWFVRFRFPGHETAKFENGLPEGWMYNTVENLSSVLRRGISPIYDEDGESLVINQKCIRDSIMDMTESRRQCKPFSKELSLRDGDTVICSTGTGTLGRVGQVFCNLENTTFDSHVTLVRAKPEIGSEFLYFTLSNMQVWFMNMGIGSTNQQELYRSTIKNAKVIVPDTKAREMFNRIVAPMHKSIVNLTAEVARLRTQRDLLLPRLISGKLEVQ